MKTFCAKALRGARQLRGHGAAVSAMWAIAPGHDSIVALHRGYGAHSSDDLTLDQDALARNEIDAMVAMLAMVNEGNGAIVAMVAMGGAFHTRRMQPLLHVARPHKKGILRNISGIPNSGKPLFVYQYNIAIVMDGNGLQQMRTQTTC